MHNSCTKKLANKKVVKLENPKLKTLSFLLMLVILYKINYRFALHALRSDLRKYIPKRGNFSAIKQIFVQYLDVEAEFLVE